MLDTMTQMTRSEAFKLCKVQWSRHSEAEVTWEREDT
jgi:hypothetical protein